MQSLSHLIFFAVGTTRRYTLGQVVGERRDPYKCISIGKTLAHVQRTYICMYVYIIMMSKHQRITCTFGNNYYSLITAHKSSCSLVPVPRAANSRPGPYNGPLGAARLCSVQYLRVLSATWRNAYAFKYMTITMTMIPPDDDNDGMPERYETCIASASLAPRR